MPRHLQKEKPAPTEWDGLGNTQGIKRVKKLSVFMSVFEDDTVSIKTYANGSFGLDTSHKEYTGGSAPTGGSAVAPLAKYILAIGEVSERGTTDMIRKQRTSKKLMTTCVEITCTTDKNFQIHAGTWIFKTRDQLAWTADLSKTLK